MITVLHGVPIPWRNKWREFLILGFVGMFVFFVGVAVLLGSSGKGAVFSISLNDVELLVAAAAWGLYTVLGKKYGTQMDPLTLTAGAAIFGALPSDVAGLATFRSGLFHMDAVAWIARVYVSTAASVIAYFVWTLGVEWVGASRAAPWMNLLPVWTTISGIVLLGERVSVMQLIGGARGARSGVSGAPKKCPAGSGRLTPADCPG